MDKKVCLVIGAGATRSDAQNVSPVEMQPPLDKHFFKYSQKTDPGSLQPISQYFSRNYQWNILDEAYDSLELIMVGLYIDSFNPAHGSAQTHFRNLVRLYFKRLVETTNNLVAHKRRNVYRLLYHYLYKECLPAEQLTLITFNHDLQVEKMLELFCSFHDDHSESFCFPSCYSLTPLTVSRPPAGADVFERSDLDSGIRILKLHGSFNWFSPYEKEEFSTSKMFAKSRELHVTPRKELDVEMRFKKDGVSKYTFPVIIPPIINKAAIIPPSLHKLWNLAEDTISSCNELVIFGYSFPPADIESGRLFERGLNRNQNNPKLIIIDPKNDVVARALTSLKPRRLSYYQSVTEMLS
jgi:hypothetical protein